MKLLLDTNAIIPAEPVSPENRQCPFAWCKTFGPNALIRG
jgi:hypothetical protein